MSNLLRKIVSGNKARFKDSNLNIDLDLVYLTDHVIIMGFPATGAEGIYRNRREDVKKFLEQRHGKNFWVFNFCPIKENSYPATFFDGRVSRYPFPDHHAPPLALLPLVAREIRQWLSGSSDRVVVLHCKAGKGRSGTVACSYLLTLSDSPGPPRLESSYSAKEWAKIRTDRLLERVEKDEVTPENETERKVKVSAGDKHPSVDIIAVDKAGRKSNELTSGSPRAVSPANDSLSSFDSRDTIAPLRTNTLEGVLALHSSRRMKAPSSPEKKAKQGVSIPSQRRWLFYWSLILGGLCPRNFWSIPPQPTKPKVRLRSITVRMHELGGIRKNAIKLANNFMERTVQKDGNSDRGRGQIWISLARYNDEFVDLIEGWERHTRDISGNMGMMRPGSGHMDEQSFSDIFGDGKWDKSKMVRSFARLGNVNGAVRKERTEQGQITAQTLQPISEQKWKSIERDIEKDDAFQGTQDSSRNILSTASSMTDVNIPVEYNDSEGILLDAHREVRAKLYIGRVFMGWFWFIPVFHMSSPTPPSSASYTAMTHFTLTRKELDFAIGVGYSIIDVDVALDWVPSSSADTQKSPPQQTRINSLQDVGVEHGNSSIIATLQSALNSEGIGEAIEVTQATEQ